MFDVNAPIHTVLNGHGLINYSAGNTTGNQIKSSFTPKNVHVTTDECSKDTATIKCNGDKSAQVMASNLSLIHI